jgi:hypothetical protein
MVPVVIVARYEFVTPAAFSEIIPPLTATGAEPDTPDEYGPQDVDVVSTVTGSVFRAY